MNITVYLGANLGTDPALPQAVQQLGRWIGESGNALVYGGSKSGLMGLLADSVLAAGGSGISPLPPTLLRFAQSLKNDIGKLTSQTRGTAVHGFVRRSFFIKMGYRGVRR